jgi:hypothetical protein
MSREENDMGTKFDANGYEIDMAYRGLRLCQSCNLVMSEGFSTDNGDVYACDEQCLRILGVEQSTQREIENDDGSAVYWTDWDGDDSSGDAINRLKFAPYFLEQYAITVEVSHIRTYTVTAASSEEALAKYQDGQAEFDNDDLKLLETWEEDMQSAVVNLMEDE